MGEVEYRERCSFYFRFRPLDKRVQNSILLDAQSEGIAVWELQRYASFIAITNQKGLLTDPSGSRRFICIEGTVYQVVKL